MPDRLNKAKAIQIRGPLAGYLGFPVHADDYVIQNAGYCGNCLRFWRPDGHGYTLNLEEAWIVGKAQAEAICSSRPTEDIPWLLSVAIARSERHVH